MQRKDIEDREGLILAPYAMKSSQSRGRKYPESEHEFRSVYQRDRDRIVHSSAFRKLEYKTQVFVNHQGDNFRTRLTHTMEVSQIARSIARNLRLNEDLTEALALCHDLGHTPFGHAGEDALNLALDQYRERLDLALKSGRLQAGELKAAQARHKEVAHLRFEHNAHGLRIVEQLETKYPDFPGINLTYEVRESIVKHNTRHDTPDASAYEPDKMPLLEAQVVDIADAIAYDNHDIEDAINMGIMTEEDFEAMELWRRANEFVRKQHPDISRQLRILLSIKFIINLEVTDLIQNSLRQLRAHKIQSVDDVRGAGRKLIDFSPEVKAMKTAFQEFMLHKVYRHYKISRMARKAHRFICDLFAEFTSPGGETLLPRKYHDWYLEVGTIGICDYIAGMTDRQAQDEYKKLFHPFERV